MNARSVEIKEKKARWGLRKRAVDGKRLVANDMDKEGLTRKTTSSKARNFGTFKGREGSRRNPFWGAGNGARWEQLYINKTQKNECWVLVSTNKKSPYIGKTHD